MRIDVVSIFPDYLAPLRLSLVGKAVESGTLDLRVHDLRAHTLAELEASLEDKGYHLDNTLLSKLIRAFVHYVEETELHNLEADGERPRNKSQNQAYTQAWERHPHGDHDTTPPEWREYK